jgi:hypothetical protein
MNASAMGESTSAKTRAAPGQNDSSSERNWLANCMPLETRW